MRVINGKNILHRIESRLLLNSIFFNKLSKFSGKDSILNKPRKSRVLPFGGQVMRPGWKFASEAYTFCSRAVIAGSIKHIVRFVIGRREASPPCDNIMAGIMASLITTLFIV